jgi:putative lipoprotein
MAQDRREEFGRTAVRRRLLVAVSFSSLAALAACSSRPTLDSGVDALLAGREWRLVSIEGQPALAGTTVTASFSTEGRVGGSGGCNSYGGSAAASDGRLLVGDIASTLMACERGEVMAQEGRFLGALRAARRYSVEANQLRLGPTETETTLVFSPR